jgi:hypothetical protein
MCGKMSNKKKFEKGDNLDINNLSDLEYKYKFNINDLNEALVLIEERNDTLQNSTCVQPELKEKIKRITNDIDLLINKIIDRDGIKCLDDYNNAIEAAILANCEIQIMVDRHALHKGFGNLKKKNPLYSKFKQWQSIQAKIGSKDWGAMVTENHSTILSLLVISLAVLFLGIVGICSESLLLVMEALFLFIVISIAFILLSERLYILEDIDRQYRIKNLTNYRSGTTLKVKNQKFLSLLLNLIKKA